MKKEGVKGNLLFKNIYECSKYIFFETKNLISINETMLNQLYCNSNLNEYSHKLKSIEVNSNKKYHVYGYPTGNYLKIICKCIEIWAFENDFPYTYLNVDNLKDRCNEIINSYKSINNYLYNILCFYNNKEEIIKNLVKIYNKLKEQGILIMIGLRITYKCVFELPPNKNILINKFNKLCNDKCKLTVGARAITKHSDRSKFLNKNESIKFWGIVVGNEEERNTRSNLICLDLLANSSWITIFDLNIYTRIIEIRNTLGYGLRWEYINNYLDIEFKGAIEPQISTFNN